MASSDSRLNYVPAPQPALSQSACLALSLTKSNKVFGGTGILKWIHLYRFPGGHRHLLEDKSQSTVHYQPQGLNWIINLWEQLKLRKRCCFLGGRGHISDEARGKILAVFCHYSSFRVYQNHNTSRNSSTVHRALFTSPHIFGYLAHSHGTFKSLQLQYEVYKTIIFYKSPEFSSD